MNCEKTGDYGRSFSDYQATMAENPAGSSDYESLTRGKLCPLKSVQGPLTVYRKAGPIGSIDDLERGGVLRVVAGGDQPRLEYIGEQCDGPRCAWWDIDKEHCAVLSLARNK